MRTGPAILKSLTGFIICGFFLAINITTSADIIYVSTCGNDSYSGTDPCCQAPDGPKATIQAALDAAADYDTVIIAAGIYTGTGNRDINVIDGRSVTVRSTDPNDPDVVAATIIDCQGTGSENHRAFYCETDLKTDFTLAGLTIINSYSDGAVLCANDAVDGIQVIDKCIFKDNVGIDRGGAIYLLSNEGHVHITSCTFQNNVAYAGGAIYSWWSEAHIKNCLFSGNVSTADSDIAGGGAIMGWVTLANVYDFEFQIENCTFTGNQAVRGGAMAFIRSTDVSLRNNILWDNKASAEGDEVYINTWISFYGYFSVDYCDLQGGESGIVRDLHCSVSWGAGNIDTDPDFVDPCYGDYHLLSISPCVDSGDPCYVPDPCETDIDGQPRILYDRVDIGADEVFPIAGDTEPDEDIDLADLAVFAGYILSDCDAPLWCDNCDADRSGKVTIEDFAHFSAHFLKGIP